MRALIVMTALAGGLAVVPASAQQPQQLLQGLLSGNQSQDQAVRDAFERGYQKGRQDEARLHGPNGRSDGSSASDRSRDDRDDYNSRGNYRPSDQPGSSYSR